MGGIIQAATFALGLLTQGFGYVEQGVLAVADAPHKLCVVMGGEYKGTSEIGGTKEGVAHATVPFCTAGPSTLVENAINGK